MSCGFFWNPALSHPAPNVRRIIKRRRQQTKQTDPQHPRCSRKGLGKFRPLGSGEFQKRTLMWSATFGTILVCFFALFRVLCVRVCVCIDCFLLQDEWSGAIHFTSLKTLGFQKARGRLLAARSARGNGGSSPWRIHFKGQDFTWQACLLITMEESIPCL